MGDFYHRAARDGVLELLKTATKRDANRKDEDGMSPVHYAASCGNVEALRLLVGKGGEPDQPNQEGASAVHLAASCGQLNCLSFLTNFGSNIWALDNEGRTPLEEAALHGRMDCVRHLDGLIAIQMTRNRKEVERCRRGAKKDMMNRVRKQEKRFQSREYAYEKKIARETKRRTQSDSSKNIANWNGTGGLVVQQREEKPFSELTHVGTNFEQNETVHQSVKSHSSDTFRFGSRRFRMLGALRDKFGSLQSKSGSRSEPKIIHQRSLDEARLFGGLSKSNPSILDHLEFDTVENQPRSLASDFRNPFKCDKSDVSSGHMVRRFDDKGNAVTQVHYVPKRSHRVTNGSVASHTSHRSGLSTDTQPSSSLSDIHTLKSVEGDDSVSQSDMGVENIEAKALVTLMVSLNLEQFTGTLVKESIDLNTLSLCTDEDLKSIGIPLGPRRKILDAVKKRAAVLNHPGPMTDSRI